MAGIWGDGQRGGIFGARVDPRLQAELERRAEAKRQELAAEDTIGKRAQDWWNSTTFLKPAYDDLVGGATMFGDVMSGAQPTMAADPQTGEFHTDPRLADRAMNAAGAVTLGAGAIPAEVDALRMGIKAYHGSPHDFERFDSSKIGTGEGAQAYGYGLYAAENEAVAKQYRDLLGTRSSAVGDPVARAQFWASDLGSREAAVTHLEGVLKQAESRPKNFEAGDLEKTRQAIDYLKSGGDLMPKSGHMYEVDIAADPEHFLDWDKPLSEQSPQVQQSVAKLEVGGERPIQFGELRDTFLKPMAEAIKGTEFERFVKPDDFYSGNVDMGEVRRSLAGNPDKLAKIEELQAAFQKHSALRGSDVYNTLARSYEDRIGGGLTAARDSPAVADQLRDLGIPGIRYLDQGSRGAGTGTSNYVVFDDKLISILRKYGLPISAAGLAALSQLHPEEAQAAQQKGKR